MRIILVSRHTGGREPADSEQEQLLKDLGEWVALLKAEIAIPIRGGKSVTAKQVAEYGGDIGGVLIFEADSLDQAVVLAMKSPGLKFGWTHDVFPETPLTPSGDS